MNNRNNLVLVLSLLVFVLASCLAPVGIEPGGKVHSERYETIDLQTRGMEYKVKTPAQWQIIMRLINIKSANALRAAQAAESEENVPQAASSADTQTIAPVYTMILGAGANITLPSSGAELNPPLTTEGVTLIVKGEDSANPSTLTLGGDGTLLDIGANRTLILENVILQGKANNTGGPLIKVQSGAVELREGTVITGNTRTGGSGGGIFLDGGSLLAGQGTKITGNSASGGGGIYAQSNASLTIEGVIGGGLPGEGNNAGGDGGGIYLSGGAVIALEDGAEIVGNTAGNGGGGIYFNGGTHEIGAGVKISRNSASGGSGKGGGIYANNAVLTLEGVIGGASQSEGNTATIQGGGIYLSGGSLTLEDGAALSWNTTTTTVFVPNGPYGGGGVNADGAAVTMNGSSAVSNNSSGSGYGGGIHLTNGGSLTMNGNSSVSRNIAYVGGGVSCGGNIAYAVTMNENSVIGGGSAVDGNTSTQGSGGIYLLGSSYSFEMRDNAAISYNTNTSNTAGAGGVYAGTTGSTTVTIIMTGNAVIRNNTTNSPFGGGMSIGPKVNITLSGNAKIGGTNGGNSCTGSNGNAGGGGIYFHYNSSTLRIQGNAKISHNYTAGKGGGVWKGLATNQMIISDIVSGSISGNTAGNGYPDIHP